VRHSSSQPAGNSHLGSAEMGPGQQPTTGGRGPQPQPSSRNDAGMYGLAAELTQTGQLQQPARPAPTSRVSQPVQLPPMQPRMPAGSGLQQQAAMAPFGLAPELLSQQQLQRGRLPPEDDNQPYGLVAELQGAAGSNPLAIRPAAGDPHMTATARRHQAAARRALGNQMAQMSSQQPSALKPPPIGVSDLEPDYGLVAELKGNVASDPLSQRQAFGLAAEVCGKGSLRNGKHCCSWYQCLQAGGATYPRHSSVLVESIEAMSSSMTVARGASPVAFWAAAPGYWQVHRPAASGYTQCVTYTLLMVGCCCVWAAGGEAACTT
jgi:hypothetical protein